MVKGVKKYYVLILILIGFTVIPWLVINYPKESLKSILYKTCVLKDSTEYIFNGNRYGRLICNDRSIVEVQDYDIFSLLKNHKEQKLELIVYPVEENYFLFIGLVSISSKK